MTRKWKIGDRVRLMRLDPDSRYLYLLSEMAIVVDVGPTIARVLFDTGEKRGFFHNRFDAAISFDINKPFHVRSGIPVVEYRSVKDEDRPYRATIRTKDGYEREYSYNLHGEFMPGVETPIDLINTESK